MLTFKSSYIYPGVDVLPQRNRFSGRCSPVFIFRSVIITAVLQNTVSQSAEDGRPRTPNTAGRDKWMGDVDAEPGYTKDSSLNRWGPPKNHKVKEGQGNIISFLIKFAQNSKTQFKIAHSWVSRLGWWDYIKFLFIFRAQDNTGWHKSKGDASVLD